MGSGWRRCPASKEWAWSTPSWMSCAIWCAALTMNARVAPGSNMDASFIWQRDAGCR